MNDFTIFWIVLTVSFAMFFLGSVVYPMLQVKRTIPVCKRVCKEFDTILDRVTMNGCLCLKCDEFKVVDGEKYCDIKEIEIERVP